MKPNNTPSKTNPFKDYFERIEVDHLYMTSSTKFYNNKYRLGEPESNEIALEVKINKQLNGKNNVIRRKIRFPSNKELNQIDLTQSLKNLGVLKAPDEEHLIIRKMPQITDEQYYEIQNRITNTDYLKNLYEHLKTVNCNFKSTSCDKSISGLSPLTYLIESFYGVNKEKANEMNDKYNLLKPYIYNYRAIYGDGNCFYRAAIFRYLEILILNKKIVILKKVVYDVIQSFNSEELKKRRIILNNDIKPDLTFKILFLIVDLLKNDMITEAHQILVKSFSTCQKFDYAMILYFRYILYDYIKKNENKIYLKDFPIKLGNLLPSQYETEEGEFLFNSFYENYLLRIFSDAEKIIIYLTPFVLGIELDIIIFDINSDILQKFVWEGESEIKTDEVISLLNNRNHYEIVYSKKDNERNKKYYELFENNIKSVIILEKDKYLTPRNEENNNKAKDDFKILKPHKNPDINEIKDEKKPQTVLKKKIKMKNNIINIQNNNNNINININNNKNNNNNNNKNINNINNINNNINNINNSNNINNNNNSNNNNININSNNNNNNININYIQKNNNEILFNNFINNKDNNTTYDNNNPSNFINNNNNPNIIKDYINNTNNSNINNMPDNNNKPKKDVDHCNKINLINKSIINNNSNFINSNDNDNDNDNIFKKQNKTIVNKNINQNNFNFNKISNEINNNQIRQLNSNKIIARNIKTNNNYNINNLNNPNYDSNEIKRNDMIDQFKPPKQILPNKLNKNDDKKLVEYRTPDNNLIQNNNNINNINYNNAKNNNYSDILNMSNQNTPNNNTIKCERCNKNIILNNQELPFCQECFKYKIYKACMTCYQNTTMTVDSINVFLEFNLKKYNLINLIEIYNKNFEKKLNQDNIVNRLHKRQCIFIEEHSNNKYYELPCGCKLCNYLLQYFNSFQFNTHFICRCSKEYSRIDMIKLGILFLELQKNDIALKVKEYFDKRLKKNCCVCNNVFKEDKERFEIKRIISQDYNKYNCKEEHLNYFLKVLSHFVCEKCFNDKKERFICNICRIAHQIINN